MSITPSLAESLFATDRDQRNITHEDLTNVLLRNNKICLLPSFGDGIALVETGKDNYLLIMSGWFCLETPEFLRNYTHEIIQVIIAIQGIKPSGALAGTYVDKKKDFSASVITYGSVDGGVYLQKITLITTSIPRAFHHMDRLCKGKYNRKRSFALE